MDVVLIRHTEPVIAPGLCYGSLDVPARVPCVPALAHLTETLKALQADGTLAMSPARWFSSPAQRCAMLAGQLAPQGAAQVSALREIDFGQWEGQAWDAIPRMELDAWAADVMGYRGHGGESAAAMHARVAAWADALPRTDLLAMGVVTHAGVIRQLAAHWLREPLETILGWPLAYGAVTVFRLDAEGAALRVWNR
ncbi:histidine phosphatase family protein [Imbroritus primus]|uniref:histidine phosphatase family protein n=1 Tax=Imbroritus primus TaxID=3058603 RepID=UPI003D161F84